jgi:hypothetical protein
MAEADPSEIVLIDKHKHSAERLKDVAGVQRAMDSVGSVQNITLTALARNRRVLFLEGDDDFRLLRRFARRLGFDELAAGFGITSLESGGFGSWQRITTLADGIGQALGTPLMIGAVYDRDYFCRKRSLPSLKRSRGISDLLMCISAKRSRTTFLCPTRSIAPLPEQLPTALRALALPLATYQRQQGFYKKSQIP